MKNPSGQIEQREFTDEDERELIRVIDAYLLGTSSTVYSIPFLLPGPFYLVWERPPEERGDVETRLLGLLETRLRPFLEQAELAEEFMGLPETTFRERLLRFRCYLAEPDEPSEAVLNKLRLIVQTVHTLGQFLRGELRLLELKRVLRPLRKSLAAHAPELHALLYSMAEQMSMVGENSPEDIVSLHSETTQRCGEWLSRLYAYWYALLG